MTRPARRRLAGLGALLVAALTASPATVARARETQSPRRVLILYAHEMNAPGVIRFTGQLKAALRARIPTGLEIYEEPLDLDRFPERARGPQLLRYFTEKYQHLAPDVIVTEGTPALRFVVDHLAGLFPDVPVVYGAAFEPGVDYAALPRHVVGRRQPLPFAATYALARALQPDAERVVVVGGASPTDSLLVAEARRQITPLLKGARLAVYQDWSYEALVDSLRRLPARTFVVLSDFRRDQRGRKLIPGNYIGSVTRVASVPVYGIARNWVGDGIVGGGVMDFGDDGARIGRILLQILARRPDDPLPAPEVAATPLVVDWRELQRWGLSPDRLPRGVEVLFRPPSLWKQHRSSVLALLGFLVVESALLALLLIERKQRLHAQRSVEQTRAQVEHMARVATVNELATGVSHQLRQPLAAIRFNAEAGALFLAQTPPNLDDARLALQDIAKDNVRASEVIEHYRALLRKHEPISTTVDVNAVCRAIATLVAHEVTGRRARLVLDLAPDVPPVLGDPVQLQQAVINLTLNALDALSASSSHREATITTLASEHGVELRVSDTGPGLTPEVQARLFEPFFSTKPHGLGVGLTTVRSIVERHHGVLRAENGSAGGAVFTVTLPVGDGRAIGPPPAS